MSSSDERVAPVDQRGALVEAFPIGHVSEKDAKAVLSPGQWAACEEQDLPQAMMYWENIKQYHDQRVKKGNENEARRVIFFE